MRFALSALKRQARSTGRRNGAISKGNIEMDPLYKFVLCISTDLSTTVIEPMDWG